MLIKQVWSFKFCFSFRRNFTGTEPPPWMILLAWITFFKKAWGYEKFNGKEEYTGSLKSSAEVTHDKCWNTSFHFLTHPKLFVFARSSPTTTPLSSPSSFTTRTSNFYNLNFAGELRFGWSSSDSEGFSRGTFVFLPHKLKSVFTPRSQSSAQWLVIRLSIIQLELRRK